MKYIDLINKRCPIRTCASCEYTYWGGWKADRGCPKCQFAHYGAAFVYDGWWCAIWQLVTNRVYNKKQKWSKAEETEGGEEQQEIKIDRIDFGAEGAKED